MKTQLFRSRTDAMLAGVCGGLGRAFGIDVTLVRLVFVLLALGGGSGMLIYVICWLIMPLEDGASGTDTATDNANPNEVEAKAQAPNPQSALLVGGMLIVLGVSFLLRNMGFGWMGWMHMTMFWPFLLIAFGVVLLLRRMEKV